MRQAVFDIETDGFDCTVIWCITVYDIQTEEYTHFGPEEIEEGLLLLSSYDELIGHNIIDFDLWVIKLLYDIDLYSKKLTDTVVLSRMSYVPRIKHSLEAWGVELGFAKVGHEDWSQYTPEMRIRNIVDVKLNYKVYVKLMSELEDYSEKSIDLEMRTTKWLRKIKDKGFPIDIPSAIELKETMYERRWYIEEQFQSFPKQIKILGDRKGGRGENAAPYTAIDWVDFNPSSNKHVIDLLEGHWNPVEKTPTGQPKLSERNFETVHKDAPQVVKLIPEYNMLVSRTAWIDSVFEALGEDDHVHGSMTSCGAGTHRSTHFKPNMANIAGKKSPYGKECRSIFTGGDKDKYTIVGIDAAGIQLRVLAHMMNDPEYIYETVHGDVHTKNLEALGIDKGKWREDKGEWEARDTAKTFIYAFLLGASVGKLAQICSVSNGQALKQRFLDKTPALGTLMERVRKFGNLRKKLKLIDGRYIKPFPDYCCLTPILQGNEAIFMKTCLCHIMQWFEDEGLDAWIAAFVHDEFQIVCRHEEADRIMSKCEQIFSEAGEELGFRLPMEGEAKKGESWYETH